MAVVTLIFTLGTSQVASVRKQYEADDWKELQAEFAGTPETESIKRYALDAGIKVFDTQKMERGKIVYFSSNEVICESSLIIPGTAILPKGLLAVFYGLTLIYLFLGIGIVSEVFMAGIERITSQTTIVEVKDGQGQVVRTQKITVWNPTIANLTLMALGSSAPEILLSVIETTGNLGGCPGELGASTIVGSAAFNLLVISAVSIYAVNEKNDTDPDRDDTVPLGVKKIYDMGVFCVTAFSSIFAYVWIWIVLADQSVSTTEAWLTLIFFFVLIGLAFGMDKYKAMQVEKEKLAKGEHEKAPPVTKYTAKEIYEELISEKQGKVAEHEEHIAKREEMKSFLKETQQTDQIERVDMANLKKAVEGETLIGRIKYRRQIGTMMTGKRKLIAKGEIVKDELLRAEDIAESERNPHFGFQCLHYSVSESSGHIRINVVNKQGVACSVRVKTEDKEALAGEDYEAVDTILEFRDGENVKHVDVKIMDDDAWEPDEDFYVQLMDAGTGGSNLSGKDCRTRVTIIDDDQPGQVSFEESKGIKALASQTDETIDVVLQRKKGSDGRVTVDWKTVELDESEHTATEGVDYEKGSGTAVFEHGMSTATIQVVIKGKEADVQRDESFRIQLENITPAGAKLSKKSAIIVNITTDVEGKKKQEALAQLMQRAADEEEISFRSQFIQACMLHPTKNEDGEIEDIEFFDAFLHFATIGWKLLFAFIPPPHMLGGWGCFIISLCFIGFVTFVVGEFANLFGCVLNIKPAVTAITFVALGTSLPDTFASMAAASAEKYADSAIGNVTGSNSVNVFLGLGLPWVIAVLWEGATPAAEKGYDPVKFGKASQLDWSNGNYYVPAGSLGFSVAVFVICAVLCVVTLVIRRYTVKGELGGSDTGRAISALFLISLWFLYIIMSILQAYGVAGLDKLTMGIAAVGNPNCSCYAKPADAAKCAAANK